MQPRLYELPPRHRAPRANLALRHRAILGNPAWTHTNFQTQTKPHPVILPEQFQRIEATGTGQIVTGRAKMTLDHHEKEALIALQNGKYQNQIQGNLNRRVDDRAAAGGIKQQKQRCMMAAPGFIASIGGSVVIDKNNVPNDGSHGIHVGYPSPSPYSRNTPSVGSLSQMRSQSCFSFGESPSNYRTCVPQQDLNPPQPPASVNGRIYHPLDGYSPGRASIFEMFPDIVKYRDKHYGEADRIRFLLSRSQKPFCGANGRPLGVDESAMWFDALNYLISDITEGYFEYMTKEMQHFLKELLSTHNKRLVLLDAILHHGFLCVVSDFSEKLSRKEIQQPLPLKKQEEWNNMLALQQAKQKLMEQQMAHVPVASVHPTVTPLKLLTPDPMRESPPQHIPPRRKRLSLTYAPPPQYASVMMPPRLATMNGVAVPFIPTKEQLMVQPQRSQVGNINAMPFDSLAFNRGTARSLRSQRAVSSPFCMLPTSASSNYPRSNLPMTSIESRGPMAPFIEPSNSSADDLLFAEIMAEIDQEMASIDLSRILEMP